MLYGLMGAVISAKKPIYGVGEYPTYIISGQPDAEILWTTYINGKEIELEMVYGDFIESDGTVEILWPDPFYAYQIGTWKREVTLLNPDGTKEKASLTFTVQQNPVGTPAGPAAPGQTPGTVPGAVTTPPPPTTPPPAPVPPPPTSTVPPPPPRGVPTTTPTPYPPVDRPGANPPGTVTTPPIIPPGPGDILNPAPVPPRDIYPVGQEPRPPIDRGPVVERPVVTAPPGDILNPTPLPPSLPSPLPAPVPPMLPGANLPPPGSTGPMPQGPSSGAGFDLGGSVSVGGYDIPVWLVAVGVLFLFKGR